MDFERENLESVVGVEVQGHRASLQMFQGRKRMRVLRASACASFGCGVDWFSALTREGLG